MCCAIAPEPALEVGAHERGGRHRLLAARCDELVPPKPPERGAGRCAQAHLGTPGAGADPGAQLLCDRGWRARVAAERAEVLVRTQRRLAAGGR